MKVDQWHALEDARQALEQSADNVGVDLQTRYSGAVKSNDQLEGCIRSVRT